jgi:TonB family protein
MARRAGIEGRVYVQFIVNENGDVEEPRVIRGIGGGADEEALRAVRDAKFKPGVQRGRPVRVQYSLPVVFKLNNSARDAQVEAEQPEPQSKSMTYNVYFKGDNLTGQILDGSTGQPLAGTNVILEGTNVGTVTNSNGEFSISKDGINASRLIISRVGYTLTSIDLEEL